MTPDKNTLDFGDVCCRFMWSVPQLEGYVAQGIFPRADRGTVWAKQTVTAFAAPVKAQPISFEALEGIVLRAMKLAGREAVVKALSRYTDCESGDVGQLPGEDYPAFVRELEQLIASVKATEDLA